MITSGQVRRVLAALFMLALVGATSCTTNPDVTRSEQEDGATAAPARLRFETVRSILEDSKGNYWFGSWKEGVCRFDGESLTYFTVEDGLSDNQIRSIQEDRNGVVWFEGGVGISGFDGERIISYTSKNYTSKDEWLLRTGDLWFKEDGSIGATEVEGQPGVYRYDGMTFTYLAYPLPADRNTVAAYATTGMSTGKGGRRWFATYSAVVGYDGESFTVIDDKSLGLKEDAGSLHVRCVLEDSKGNLWIGNNGIGVILHDGDAAINFTQEKGLGKLDQRVGRLTHELGDVTDDSPSLHRVFSIGEDRTGNIWFGTVEHGAWRYDGKSLRNYTAEDGLTSKDIMGIYTDRHGDLWLAGNGVFKFNGASFDRIH
ncbi:MAG: diguanylate cyclase [Planctomycetes bacterium]|nr:diguanylate cyclase [Planctomycetota bacterium]